MAGSPVTMVYTPLKEGYILSIIANEPLSNDTTCTPIPELLLVLVTIWSKVAICVNADTPTYWLLWLAEGS